MSSPFNRREFAKAALAGAAVGAAPAVARAGRIIGANDRVRIGCIGVGYRGVQVLNAFLTQKDAQIVALCDVYEPYLNGQFDQIHPHFKELGYVVPSRLPDFGGPVERHKDFRRVLDQKDIDAVIVATPDHWHSAISIAAMDAGKDVYCEKPMVQTVAEGQSVIAAQERTGRIFQVGSQYVTSLVYQKAREMIAGVLTRTMEQLVGIDVQQPVVASGERNLHRDVDVQALPCHYLVRQVRGEVIQRVIAPEVGQALLDQRAVIQKLVYRHQLDGGDPKALQMVDDRFRCQRRRLAPKFKALLHNLLKLLA